MKTKIIMLAVALGVFAGEGAVKVGGFWSEQYRRMTKEWIPHCIRQMEKGGDGEELLYLYAAAEINSGRKARVEFTSRKYCRDPKRVCPWVGAYVYNTAEAICLALEIEDDPYLRGKLEEWTKLIVAAQEKSGYIHPFVQALGLKHYAVCNHHELYEQAYLIDLGVAHMRLTGGRDRRLFDAAKRLADHLAAVLGPYPHRNFKNPHAGVEYACLRLAEAVDRWDGKGKGRRYAEWARFMIRNQYDAPDELGTVGKGAFGSRYCQCDRPAWEMTDIYGHSVRAAYFCVAMEAIGRLLGDMPLARASDRLFDSAVNRKMYLTGGIGSSWRGEAFEEDYELPQNSYCEACASCGLAFWCLERAKTRPGVTEPFDVYERALYNNVLGSVSADGRRFLYQNPLTSNRPHYAWHVCPCCIGNIPRTLLALKDNLVSVSPDGRTLYVNNYMDIETDDFRMETAYPADGKVKFTVKRGRYDRILARFPNRAESKLYRMTPEVPHGYREVKGEWELPLVEQTVTAIPEVKACAGCTARQRGPIVYSWEGEDFRTKVPNYRRLTAGGMSKVWVPRDYAADPAFVKRYAAAALDAAKASVAADAERRGKIIGGPALKPRLSGGRLNFFIWDLPFCCACAKAVPKGALPFEATLDNLYLLQQPSGFICRMSAPDGRPLFTEGQAGGYNPPLLAWAELELLRAGVTDRNRLEKVYPRLVRFHGSYVRNLKRSDGLYGGDSSGSGMDGMPRGEMDATSGWIDLSAGMAFDCLNLAEIARTLGRADEARQWEREHRALADVINAKCWDESAGFYFDIDRHGKLTGRRHVGAFWTLLAKVATPERAKRMAAALEDRNLFARPVPVPSVARCERGYRGHDWHGGSWAPTTYMTIRGLRAYGFGGLAARLARRWYDVNALIFERTGRFCELLSSENDEMPVGRAQDQANDWRFLAPLALPVEFGWAK